MSTDTLRRGEHSRTEILQAAHELFVTQGYHGTSMRQIAEKAGLALGSLYNHFASKEDVFLAVFWEFHPYHGVLPAILASQGEPIEQFTRHVMDRMIASVNANPGFLNLMFIEVVEFKGAHLSQLFSALQPQWTQAAQTVIHVDRERLRPIPPLMFIRIFLGIFFAYYLTETLFAPQAPPEFRQDAVDRFIEVYLYGIMADSSSAAAIS